MVGVVLDKIKAENPGFTYDVTSNQGEYINQTIGSVAENMIVGGLLALLILFLFLSKRYPYINFFLFIFLFYNHDSTLLYTIS